jgi:serine/threonine-protein kinase
VESSPSEIGVGTVIADTYEVTGLIGAGGMGAVWAATHRRLPGKRVAVKVLKNLGDAAGSWGAESLARFRREAEIASRIGHPNIIEVLDFHTLPSGTPYMILEFLQGESLASRLRRGPLPLEAALDIARQVGSALAAAHRADVVHRDLKPDNIFLVPSDSGGVLADRVKVLDFGISKIRNSSTVQTQESALLGTPQYMSPEQAYGKNRTIDQRTDVWALGTIVYEMLVGAPAFSGETLAQVILSIVNDPAPSLAGRPGVPEQVARAVARALEKEVDRRWPDVGSFIAELTGKPLQTLDRKRPETIDPLAATAANVPTPVSSSVAHAATQATPVSVGTQPRGEVVAVPPTHRVGASSRLPLFMGVGVGLVGVAVAAFVLLRPPARESRLPDPEPREVFVHADPQPANRPAKAAPAVVPAEPPQPASVNANAKKEHAVKPSHETLPDEVKSDLDDADKKLAAGDVDGALHLARRTLTVHKSSRAFALITRAYCRAGDLGNAKANFSSVAASDRAAVVSACKKQEVDLR